MEKGEWIKADTHIHTRFSDGAHTIDEIALKAKEFGCNVIAMTDHADRDLKAATPEYAEAILAARRSHPDLLILSGLEWNVPPWGGDQHATVLVPPGPDEFLILADFKQQFDDLGREEHTAERAIAALEWLEQSATSQVSPVVMLNHPSRVIEQSQEILDHFSNWRKHTNLIVGFSGAAGHQKVEGSYKGKVSLIDRWDPAAAEVGGVWDQLLAQGEDVWVARAPSDFHGLQMDYWPGEFSETWLYVPERSAEGVLRAFQAGAFFADHGHIARHVELRIHAEGLPRPAYAGEIIEVTTGSNLAVELKLDPSAVDWEGNPSRIDRIELIAVTPHGSRIIFDEPLPEDGTFTREFTNLRAGFVLRARGRRVIADGPDLMFYTNPIRVVAVDQGIWSQLWKGIANYWRRFLAVGLMVLFAAAVVVQIVQRCAVKKKPLSNTPPAQQFSVTLETPPHRRHFLFAGLGFLLLAFYGSLVPLNLREITFDQAWRYFWYIQPWGQFNFSNRSDWGANVLLFIPMGFCWLGAWCLDRKGMLRNVWSAGLIFAFCLFTTLLIEFLQSWVHARVPSANDVYAQVVGTLIGMIAWFGFGQSVANWWRLHTSDRNPHRLMAAVLSVYVIGLVAYSLIPLDLIIHPAELYRKYRAGRIVLVPDWPSVLSSDGISRLMSDVLAYVPVGVWGSVIWADQSRKRTWVRSLLIAGSLALGIEVSQVFVMSRFVEVTDLFAACLGISIGVAGAYLIPSRQVAFSSADDQRLVQTIKWWAAAILYAGFLVVYCCWPLEVDDDPVRIERAWGRFFRVPMTALYWSSEYNAATQILKKLLLWSILGVLVSQPIFRCEASQSVRRVFLLFGLCFCAAVGTGIEFWQLMMPAHTADSTDIGLYTLGAGIGIWGTGWWHRQSKPADNPRSFATGTRVSSS